MSIRSPPGKQRFCKCSRLDTQMRELRTNFASVYTLSRPIFTMPTKKSKHTDAFRLLCGLSRICRRGISPYSEPIFPQSLRPDRTFIMLEQRRLERFDVALSATIRSDAEHGGGGEIISRVLTKDICEMGAYFSTLQPLSKGTKVRVELILPLSELKLKRVKEDKSLISVDGMVLRTEEKGMAIGFSKSYAIVALSS
jgi:hypothetical protein